MRLYFHTINHAIQVFFKVIFLGFVDAPFMCIFDYHLSIFELRFNDYNCGDYGFREASPLRDLNTHLEIFFLNHREIFYDSY